jgi:hypothetical protein
MTDRTSLGLIGVLFAAVTAVVMIIALMITRDYFDGRLTLDDGQPPLVSTALPLGPASHQ